MHDVVQPFPAAGSFLLLGCSELSGEATTTPIVGLAPFWLPPGALTYALDLAGSSDDALFWGHCIWSSMFEKAVLSFSAFLISSALT